MRTLLLAFVALVGAGSLAAAESSRYEIDADFDLRRFTISGSETIVVSNASTAPVREIHFFLYPNQFKRKNPQLNEMNHRWNYPSAFDEGWIEVGNVSGAGGESLTFELIEIEGLPLETVGRVRLPSPLAPGEETALKIGFETKVPHKYGPFGYERDTVTLQGGWHPYVVPLDKAGNPRFRAAPAASSFRGRLRLGETRDAVVNGAFFDDVPVIELGAEEAGSLSLVIAPQFYVTRMAAGAKTVVFYSLFEDRYKLARLMESLVAVGEDADESYPGSRYEEIPVVETYLRSVMTYPGEGMILLSDRFYFTVVQFDFRKLNDLELARAVGYLFSMEKAAARESLEEMNWIVEAQAWAFRNEFMRKHYEDLSTLRETAGRMGMFRPFNRMAAAPTIPFSDTYVANVVIRDTFRESLFYFNNQYPSGRVMAEKLEATLGRETAHQAFVSYLDQKETFRKHAETIAGRDLDGFFSRWSRGYPPDLNYRLADVRRNDKENGAYRTRFTVEKLTAEEIVEPVEIRVYEKGKSAQTLFWDGVGSRKDFDVRTEAEVESIEIDPRQMTLETDVYDNIEPHPWEMVIDRGDQTVSSGGLGLGMRVKMQRKRDFGKALFFNPFFTPSLFGFNSGMLLDFGGTVDGLVYKKKHEMGFGYTFTELRSGFADEKSGRLDGEGKTAALSFEYSYSNRMFEEDPMSFEEVGVDIAVYRQEIGSDFNFYRVLAKAKKIQALHPKHKIAGEVIVGHSDGFDSGDVIPAQNLLDLQTSGNMGITRSGRHLGENLLTAKVEWRHDLMSMNAKMPLNWMRRLQGVLALESGWVSRNFDDLFDFENPIWGIRYGIRFHYSFFGVRPSDFTVDVGHRLGAGSGDGTVLSLGILQFF